MHTNTTMTVIAYIFFIFPIVLLFLIFFLDKKTSQKTKDSILHTASLYNLTLSTSESIPDVVYQNPFFKTDGDVYQGNLVLCNRSAHRDIYLFSYAKRHGYPPKSLKTVYFVASLSIKVAKKTLPVFSILPSKNSNWYLYESLGYTKITTFDTGDNPVTLFSPDKNCSPDSIHDNLLTIFSQRKGLGADSTENTVVLYLKNNWIQKNTFRQNLATLLTIIDYFTMYASLVSETENNTI